MLTGRHHSSVESMSFTHF